MLNDRPLSVQSWPQAIAHVDGDSFFASCEQALHSEYKGRPLVVGGERGIATAMSKEAKLLGITRGMQNHKIKSQFPECIIVPSDYESYSLFSLRIFAIARRYTPTVEEYSIDECFADVTGLRKSLKMSYVEIAHSIKADLQRELGVTFSVGLAPSKVMAKIATGWRKPNGFTAIKARHIHYALKKYPISNIWGIGKQTASRLEKLGIKTALQFARKDEGWIEKHFNKPQLDIWHELHGHSVNKVETKSSEPKSINKSKTFTPPSRNYSYVFSQLSKNIENACIRARRHNLYTNTITIFLKKQDFSKRAQKFTLSLHTNTPHEILKAVKSVFELLFDSKSLYRSTGVRLEKLVHKEAMQRDLFNQHIAVEKHVSITSVMDEIDNRYGKHTLYFGSSMQAIANGNHERERNTLVKRKQDLLTGETRRRRIAIPYLGKVT